MERQLVTNQKGEIEFRRKLSQQQIEGEKSLDDEYDAQSVETLLKERMSHTLARMKELKNTGMPMSPYLEIGAERGQRSLVMENEIGASGAAADISFDMLKSCDHYKKAFDMQRAPARLCCDANNLPLKSNSLPFVFCYETLHHFPDPSPIVAEIFRVIRPGGYFVFEEEPYKKVLHWNLYRGSRMYSAETLNRNILQRFFDRFFAVNVCNEIEYGIIENHEISTAQWKNALSPFDTKDVWLRPSNRSSFRASLFSPAWQPKYLAAYLFGGSITGVCRKQSPSTGESQGSIYQALVCPACRQHRGSEESLLQSGPLFTCAKCSTRYPVVDGVAFLFEPEKFRELYPEIFESFQSR
jgi:ubiquinone/menaquinone biosynthesis C-methylase UbiE/uncharacterized protein YbaR (Trm112 family)